MRHYSTTDLIGYLDGPTADVTTHLHECVSCASRLRELKHFVSLLRDPTVWESVDGKATAAELDEDFVFEWDEDRGAPAIPASLFASIEGDVRDYLNEHPDARSGSIVQHLIDEAIQELDRKPKRALEILDVAERIVATVDSPDAVADYQSEIWRQRANALRMLGDYQQALDATDLAEAIAIGHVAGAFALAHIIYTRGTVLFKQGRYPEAIAAAQDSAMRFSEYGDQRQIAYSRNLEAVARMEEGDVSGALEVYCAIRPQFEQLGDHQTVARLTANIAVAYLRLGQYENAQASALEAQGRYRDLGIRAEETRMEWALGAIGLARQDHDAGVTRMLSAIRSFEDVEMFADAGHVKLDLVEEYLAHRRYAEAAELARDAAETFTRSGARLHQMKALFYLREAVKRQVATPATVRYVRGYILADDPERPFQPEQAGM